MYFMQLPLYDSATSIETRSTDTPASLATTTARSAPNTTSNPSKNKHVCSEIAVMCIIWSR